MNDLQKKKRFKKYLFISIPLIIGISFLLKPASHLINASKYAAYNYGFIVEEGHADDVSRLNLSAIEKEVHATGAYESLIKELKDLILYAKTNKVKISLAGAKHSMGGHTITPNGIRINMLPYNSLNLDTASGILTVGSGALWSDVIPYLNKYGRAVEIMQSDNAFTVGGSISVNCHGWQHNKPPISFSVISFRLLAANGDIINCSRNENEELFSLVLGGYGLFGIILDVDLKTVRNEIYNYHRILMSSGKYLSYYDKYVNNNGKVRMVYGRLNTSKEDFLQKAMLNFFEFEGTAPLGYELPEQGFTKLKRSIFLGTKENDYGKELRWNSEQAFSKTQIGKPYSRNQIMNESPMVYLNRDSSRTDILHEYFIPRKNFNKFIKELQAIIPQHKVDLLNITVRNVYEDEDTFLRYAREEVFAFVMFFNQARDEDAEREMKNLTQNLIEAASSLNGVYYLPYRLHASDEQIMKCYPMLPTFIEKKHKYDPNGIFSNMFWERYSGLRVN